jgi:hypothetical protein
MIKDFTYSFPFFLFALLSLDAIIFQSNHNVIYMNISRSVTSHVSVPEKTLVSGILHVQICVILILMNMNIEVY